MINGSWDMKRNWQKMPGNIISHMCTINNIHMMYGYWDMECDREVFVILDQILPFYPPNNLKN